MSVEDTTIADLQQRLHNENQRRFEQIEKNQDRQAEQLEQLLKNTADLPTLKSDIGDLKDAVKDIDGDRNKIKGAVKLGVGAGGLSLLAEGARWLFFRR